MSTTNDSSGNFVKKSTRKRNIVIGLFMVLGASGAAFYMDLQVNDVSYITGEIMSHVPLDCMIYFPPQGNHTVDSAQAVYYQNVVNGVNQSGVKYIGPFLRSPAFQEYMFTNCHVFNGTKHINEYQTFNKSFVDVNAYSEPSDWLKNQVSIEQKLHDYNWKSNPSNYSRIEQVSYVYGINLQSTVDELFLNGALDLDKCQNPSWRDNSDIRQCTWHDSHFVVVKHNQDLLAILDKPIEGLKLS